MKCYFNLEGYGRIYAEWHFMSLQRFNEVFSQILCKLCTNTREWSRDSDLLSDDFYQGYALSSHLGKLKNTQCIQILDFSLIIILWQ